MQQSFALIQLRQTSGLHLVQYGLDKMFRLHGAAWQAHQRFLYTLVGQELVQGHGAGERAVHLRDAVLKDEDIALYAPGFSSIENAYRSSG